MPPTFFYVNKYLESWNRFSSLWRLDKQVFIEKLATKALSWLEYDRRFEVSPLADGGEGGRGAHGPQHTAQRNPWKSGDRFFGTVLPLSDSEGATSDHGILGEKYYACDGAGFWGDVRSHWSAVSV